MTQHIIAVPVTVPSGTDFQKVVELFNAIIAHGLRDVSGSEILEIGKADQLNALKEDVKHWGAYPIEGTVNTHCMLTEFSGEGQARVTLSSLDESNEEHTIAAMVEVNTDPVDGIGHLPCVHVSFDDDEAALSLFKLGKRILLRPETMIHIEPGPNGMYWVTGPGRD